MNADGDGHRLQGALLMNKMVHPSTQKHFYKWSPVRSCRVTMGVLLLIYPKGKDAMKSNKKRLTRIALVTAAATIVAFTFIFTQIERPRPVSAIESTVAKLPLGITAEEADKMIGSPPDLITSQDGVLVTPVTMLTASNELAKQYGPTQTYSLRVWDRNGVKATVAVDSEGTVAGRWTWR